MAFSNRFEIKLKHSGMKKPSYAKASEGEG